jgi:hypothetical protein
MVGTQSVELFAERSDSNPCIAEKELWRSESSSSLSRTGILCAD